MTLLLCLGVLALVICAVMALIGMDRGPTGPATADFGPPAAAWQKNENGYFFNASETAMPAAVLKGIDVSHHQGEINWETAQNAGIDFAILRCGYGGEWDGVEANWNQDDKYWRRNADECTRLGIPFGVYLYSYATTVEEAQSEADHVARLLGLVAPQHEGLEDYTASPYQLSYPVYYDLEDKSITGVFPDEMAEMTAAFFDRLQSYGYTGQQGIYASLNWVRARFSDPGFDRWRDHLWIARFSDSLGYTGQYEMWQSSYTAPGADYGVQSETVDIDFIMRPFTLTGMQEGIGKVSDPRFVNNTRSMELHLDSKDARARLTTSEPAADAGGRKVFWHSSNTEVAKVAKDGTVRAMGDGICTVTATLADGTQSVGCTVRVGNTVVPVFATGALRGARENDTMSLADVAALKESTPLALLLDAGGSLHGTKYASLTGGMDMTYAFADAGYDLQAFGARDLAYGIARLRSDVVTASGPSLASNLRDAAGAAVFYRTTSWNRNRVTNGMNEVLQRAGWRIGVFALADPAAVGTVGMMNEAAPVANDPAQTAAEQVAALQAQGVDAILCLADETLPLDGLAETLKQLGVTAVIHSGLTENQEGPLPVLAAGLGLNGVARLDLTFTPDGRASAALCEAVSAQSLNSARTGWEDAAAADHESDPGNETTEAEQAMARAAQAYANCAADLAEMAQDDEALLVSPLFTYAENPQARKTISFGNYLATLYEEIAENDRAHWPQEWAGAHVTAVAANTEGPAYGDVTRGALLATVPEASRLQLVRTTAGAVRALLDSGTVTQTYADSLVAFDATEGDCLLVTDTATLGMLSDQEYTVLRDYGDTFWNVRMNINDLTANFTTPLTMPEAPRYGVGRGQG